MQTRMSFVKKKQFLDLWAKLNVPEKTIFVWKKEKHLEIFLYALKILRFCRKKINLFFVSCRKCKQDCHFLSTTLHTLAWMTLETFLQIKFLSNNFCVLCFSRIKKLFQSYSDFFSHLAIWPWSEITTLTSHLSLSHTLFLKHMQWNSVITITAITITVIPVTALTITFY